MVVEEEEEMGVAVEEEEEEEEEEEGGREGACPSSVSGAQTRTTSTLLGPGPARNVRRRSRSM